MTTLSKFSTIPTTCQSYVHPWTNSCWNATAGLLMAATIESFRIYSIVYTLSLMMRGRIPRLVDLQRAFLGCLQSTAFLTTSAFSFSGYCCLMRHSLGWFSMLTASYIPAFLSSLTAIVVERPSRRGLLCLYVCNVATEALWAMAESRGIVRSIQHGQVIIFGISSAFLTYYFKSGLHREEKDSVFDIIRYVIGKEEEFPATLTSSHRPKSMKSFTNRYHLIQRALKVYQQCIGFLKRLPKTKHCNHLHSCVHYSLSGGAKLFGIGFLVQLSLKLLFQMKRVVKAPSKLKGLVFSKDTLKIGAFLGGFSMIYKTTSCLLRYFTNSDDPRNSIPATLLASTAFTCYPDNTAALYILWKTMQLTYNLLATRGYLPVVPGFTVFLYSAATAVLFHAALIEPKNLRSSYWKFLHALSGGRVSVMDRTTFDVWGLNTQQQVLQTIESCKTPAVINFCFGKF